MDTTARVLAASFAFLATAPRSISTAPFPTPEANLFTIRADSTTHANTAPSVSFDAAGNSVIAWSRWSDTPNKSEVVARRYGADGRPQGPLRVVNQYRPSFQAHPAVDRNDQGQFVVGWSSFGQDGEVARVLVRAFGADGTPSTDEIAVDGPGQYNSAPAVAIDEAGGFVVAWYNELGSFVRRFDAAGRALGSQRLLSVGSNPTVATQPGGGFVVVWRDWIGSALLRVQRFGRQGAGGAVVTVNAETIPSEGIPELATATDGSFAVVWDRCDYSNLAEGCDVRLRLFNRNGAPRGSEFVVSPPDLRAHQNPTAAFDPTGYLAISWQDCELDAQRQLFDCQIDSRFLGRTSGEISEVHTLEVDGNLFAPEIRTGKGSFTVVFDSTNCDSQGCGEFKPGAYGLRFVIPPP